MPENFFDRERAAAAGLIEAAKARAAAEAELTATFQTAAEKAEREVARSRKSNAAARQSELSRIEDLHATAEEEIGRKYDAEQFEADRAREESRDKRRPRSTRRPSSAAGPNTRIASGTSTRCWKPGRRPPRSNSIHFSVRPPAGSNVCKGSGMTRSQCCNAGESTRAEVEYQGEMPPPSDDDPISRMNKGLQESQTALANLTRLRSPGLGRPAGNRRSSSFSGWTRHWRCQLPLPSAAGVQPSSCGGVGVCPRPWAVAVRPLAGQAEDARPRAQLGLLLADATRACQMLNDYAAKEYAEERRPPLPSGTAASGERRTTITCRCSSRRRSISRPNSNASKRTTPPRSEKLRRQRAAETPRRGRKDIASGGPRSKPGWMPN